MKSSGIVKPVPTGDEPAIRIDPADALLPGGGGFGQKKCSDTTEKDGKIEK